MRRGLATFGVTMLAAAGVAVAASGPTVTVSVTPDTPNSHSTLSVSAKGPFSQSGLPMSLKLTAQKGFRSSAKSVPVLCNSNKVGQTTANPCPKKSKVGSGTVVGEVQGFGTQKVPFTLYLGKPQHKGDIAAVILSATLPVFNQPENVVGRLFKNKSGSIEILFAHLVSVPVPTTLKRLHFSAHAVDGKSSLITNPPSCSGGHWTGAFQLKFSTGTVSESTAIPCKK